LYEKVHELVRIKLDDSNTCSEKIKDFHDSRKESPLKCEFM